MSDKYLTEEARCAISMATSMLEDVDLKIHGTMVQTLSNVPRDFIENWQWIVAVDAFDYGDTDPLAALVAQVDKLPANVRLLLSDIVRGRRKPNTKARPKLRGKERMKVALSALASSNVRRVVESNAAYHGDMSGKEPVEIMVSNNQNYNKERAKLARQYKISEPTVDNYRRKLQSMIENWPNL